jgi:Ni,Fe-hydrogenase III component G
MNRNIAAQNFAGGLSGSRFSNQDARSNANFAIQPAAAPAKVALKKGGVKVVAAAAAPAPSPALPSVARQVPQTTLLSSPKGVPAYVPAILCIRNR